MPKSTHSVYPAALDSNLNMPVKYKGESTEPSDVNALQEGLFAVEAQLGVNGENVYKKVDTIPEAAVTFASNFSFAGHKHTGEAGDGKQLDSDSFTQLNEVKINFAGDLSFYGHTHTGVEGDGKRIGTDSIISLEEAKVVFGSDLLGTGHTHTGDTGEGRKIDTTNLSVHNIIPDAGDIYNLGGIALGELGTIYWDNIYVNNVVLPMAGSEMTLYSNGFDSMLLDNGNFIIEMGDLYINNGNLEVNNIYPIESGESNIGSVERPFKTIFAKQLFLWTEESGWVSLIPNFLSGTFEMEYLGFDYEPMDL